MSTRTKAYRMGKQHGQAKGSWVLDGNSTSEEAQRILKGHDEGDPVVMDLCPCPLSGEWAGESIPELSDRYGVDLEDDDRASDFEEGFMDGFWDEVIRAAKAKL